MAVFTLEDGRGLEYRVNGPAGALPFVFHHGTPGCTVSPPDIERAVLAAGLRFVTYARPGYGRSSRQRGRLTVDAADDVRQLLDHLGAQRCITAGQSSGGPTALATAARVSDRVASVLVISCLAPFGVPGLDWTAGMGEDNVADLTAALDGEAAIRPKIELDAAYGADPDLDTLMHLTSTLLPGVDRAVLDQERGRFMVASMAGSVVSGADGWVDDALAAVRDWGFAVEEITAPAFLWHGDTDLIVPFGHGVWLSRRVPGMTSHLELREGHLSITAHHVERMIAEVVAAAGV
ncbi:MAG TPA: alpha/beta hydrolase [Jatrophihabitans sp.]